MKRSTIQVLAGLLLPREIFEGQLFDTSIHRIEYSRNALVGLARLTNSRVAPCFFDIVGKASVGHLTEDQIVAQILKVAQIILDVDIAECPAVATIGGSQDMIIPVMIFDGGNQSLKLIALNTIA